MTLAFWQTKTLDEMDDREWESLCDHCGQCCLVKLQDEESGEIAVTRIVCEQYDIARRRCSCYSVRCSKVDDCVDLQRHDFSQYDWMPPTCAYRLLAQGDSLPDWHPLLSGDATSPLIAGFALPSTTLRESQVADLEDHISHWLR
jgi:uncharacterized protein